METIGMLLLFVGFAVMAVGGIWFLVVAFTEGVGWGLACMFIPFVSLYFLVKFWDNAKKPFFIQLAGLVPYILGIVLAGAGAEAVPQ